MADFGPMRITLYQTSSMDEEEKGCFFTRRQLQNQNILVIL